MSQIVDGDGIFDRDGNEFLLFNKTDSAVNHLEITNAATGGAVKFEAKGDDSNISLELLSKGTGLVKIGDFTFPLSAGEPTSKFLRSDGSWASPLDENSFAFYSISCADGDNSDEEKIVLTGTGEATGTDEIVLEAGTGLSIARDSDKITFTNTLTDTNTNQLTTFTVSATTDTTPTTISQGDDLMFAAGTGITCETTADGTVTITNTNPTDTNTMGNGFTVSAETNTTPTTITEGDTLHFDAGPGIFCETTADGTVTITNAKTSLDDFVWGFDYGITAVDGDSEQSEKIQFTGGDESTSVVNMGCGNGLVIQRVDNTITYVLDSTVDITTKLTAPEVEIPTFKSADSSANAIQINNAGKVTMPQGISLSLNQFDVGNSIIVLGSDGAGDLNISNNADNVGGIVNVGRGSGGIGGPVYDERFRNMKFLLNKGFVDFSGTKFGFASINYADGVTYGQIADSDIDSTCPYGALAVGTVLFDKVSGAVFDNDPSPPEGCMIYDGTDYYLAS